MLGVGNDAICVFFVTFRPTWRGLPPGSSEVRNYSMPPLVFGFYSCGSVISHMLTCTKNKEVSILTDFVMFPSLGLYLKVYSRTVANSCTATKKATVRVADKWDSIPYTSLSAVVTDHDTASSANTRRLCRYSSTATKAPTDSILPT